MFTPIKKGRAFEAVVAQIEAAIYAGELKAGDNLPSERALVDEFNVGRSTVREALRILESMGLIKTSPGSHKGPRVSASLTQGISRMLNGAVRVEEIELVDLIQYRIMSGSTSNFLAAHLRTDEDLVEMGAAIQRMVESDKDDSAGFARADAEFHAAIRVAAGNALMELINEVIDAAIIELVATTIENTPETRATREEFIRVHRAVLKAIADGDGIEAARLARRSLISEYGASLSVDERRRLVLLDLSSESAS
ncbi:FadR/GntR family transcriptional regulator [Arthrobacter wenxiniae]|uniref:FadR family transcriptional regulator n=1 Tax=Arthrobacter wenxiniae TaxID=2713570 RepID=A0A7Y7LXW1_9MICC|nr:GntR family transcriptional regulator [Arthrobacter wenxiniae]NVM94297.1 FadR family transcriptional regulator [Arthrobacter wenxiniae]